MKFENLYLKVFIALVCILNCGSLNAQIYESSHLDKYESGDINNRIIYVGKVNGINAKKFDSLYQNKDLNFLNPLTKSTYPIEIRFSPGSIYAGYPSNCTVLYYDTCFNLKRYNGNDKSISLDRNADAFYDTLILNAIFSLTNIIESNFIKDTSFLYSKKGWKKREFKISKVDHVEFYILDYKVGDLYNRVYVNFQDYGRFPDNQLLRRFVEIKRLFMGGL